MAIKPKRKFPSLKGRKWFRIEGVEESKEIVNGILDDMEYKTVEGLLAAAEFLYDDMQKTPPLVPIDTGNLNDSWDAKAFNLVKTKPVVKAGFGLKYRVPYAIFVHERVKGAPWGSGVVGDIQWTRPDSGPKFLELALKRNYFEIPKIVAKFIDPSQWKRGKYKPPVK